MIRAPTVPILRRLHLAGGAKPLLALAVVVLVWIVAGYATRGFASWRHLRYILELAAVIGMVGIGQTLVVIGGGIDLSVGAIVTLTAVILPLLSLASDPTGIVGVALALLVAAGAGLANGIGVAWLRVQPMVMTLATATFLQGVLILVAGGSAVSLTNPLVQWLGRARPLGFSASIGLWVIAALAVLFLLHATRFGARLFVLGASPAVARLSGVPVVRTTIAAYGLSGVAAGISGLLALGMNGQGYVGIGEPYVLASIAAVVLGGTSILGGRGTYAGTLPGAVLLVTVSALITVVNASAGLRNILFGGLILGLLLLSGRDRPQR